LIRLAALLAALAMLGGPASRGQEKGPPGDDKAERWMRRKLEVSQNILDGLTRADFDKVGANAETLTVLSYLEKWARADDPAYQRQVGLFDYASRDLIRQAREKNLDGATLAYHQLTVSCVRCHKLVRDAKK
jgi:hypothetical protein